MGLPKLGSDGGQQEPSRVELVERIQNQQKEWMIHHFKESLSLQSSDNDFNEAIDIFNDLLNLQNDNHEIYGTHLGELMLALQDYYKVLEELNADFLKNNTRNLESDVILDRTYTPFFDTNLSVRQRFEAAEKYLLEEYNGIDKKEKFLSVSRGLTLSDVIEKLQSTPEYVQTTTVLLTGLILKK